MCTFCSFTNMPYLFLSSTKEKTGYDPPHRGVTQVTMAAQTGKPSLCWLQFPPSVRKHWHCMTDCKCSTDIDGNAFSSKSSSSICVENVNSDIVFFFPFFFIDLEMLFAARSLAVVFWGTSRLRCPSPHFATVLVMATLVPAVVACAHCRASCPVSVSSYLSNPEHSLSDLSSLSQLSLVLPWHQHQPSTTPPWQL